MCSKNRFRLLFMLLVLSTTPAFAQSPPDAGRTLQELALPPEAPKPSKSIDIDTSKPTPILPGGAQVVLKSVSFSGNRTFDEAALQQLIGDVVGKSYDMAGLRSLADKVAEHYRQEGYPFTRVYLPQQTLGDGALVIQVLEGKYGTVQAKGEEKLARSAQSFLSSLESGKTIESSRLERVTLILDDQPGIKSSPIIRPGQELGTGDLDVRVSKEKLFGAEIGMDNHGNRYTGEYRGRINLQLDSPFMLGDQILLRSLLTDELMWLGSFSYSLPLGSSGLRGQAGFAHTYYELGKQFESLNATGTAQVTSAGLSYPLLRSQKANITLGATYQHKDLQDKNGSVGTKNDKSSDSVPTSVQFDLRDSIGGGGITYGTFSWTPGNLALDADLKATDATTAKTNGFYNRLNLDLARMQALPAGFLLFGRLSSQWAFDNLDSSEGFGLGGPNGVRAYPGGEAYGDEGWLMQTELRYTYKAVSPYLFFDVGQSIINAKPWDTGKNHKTLAGSGLGIRFQYAGVNLDTSVAWRTEGGKPQSDTEDRNPRMWFSASYRY